MKKIVHFHRKPAVGNFSIETLFCNIRMAMEDLGSKIEVRELPKFSQGVFPRIQNTFWASSHKGILNHVTGDVTYIALGLPGKSTILTVHDCYALERLGGWRQHVLKYFWFDRPIKRCAAVTVVSQETMRQLERLIPASRGKTVVVPNAVSKGFVPYVRKFNSQNPTILQIGTAPNKNLIRLCQALEGVSCELRIIGKLKPDQVEQLKKSRINYSSTSQLSESEVIDEYKAADIVAFVSTYEGFGMPIVEAQWVERSVVTSKCSSMPEVAGKGACLVDPFDVFELRSGIVRIIEDASYRETLIEYGRQNRRRFSLPEVAKAYLKLYELVLSGKSPVGK